MDPYADQDYDGETCTKDGYNYIRELKYQDGQDEVAQPAKKLVKVDDKDADEKDDEKALTDEGYSYIRELEYQDGLEEDDEEEDDKEAQPAAPAPLENEDSDEDDDDEDQPAQELEEKDADEEDDEEDQPAKELEENEADEADDEEVQPARLAELEDMRKHLMQVRKAAEAREARRSDNAARFLWPTFRHSGDPPKARIEHRSIADPRLWRYYHKHDTFSGCEVHIKPNVSTGGPYYKYAGDGLDTFMSVDQYPKAVIEHGRDEDDALKLYFRQHRTFSGAEVSIKPNGGIEAFAEAEQPVVAVMEQFRVKLR